MRDDRRPPTLRNCTELSTAPRVSARAFPVDANLRHIPGFHARHLAILAVDKRLGYGKLCSSNPHIHVAELFGEEPELLTRTVVPAVDPDVRAVFACLRVLDVEHESVFVCDCPIGFHPRAGKPYRLRRLTADQEYRRSNRVDLVYGKLADWVCDGSGALLATACRTEVSNSDDTIRLNNQHSRGLTVGHAAHAVDFNRRPILSRQNVLALFRIPTASTNRAAELHEYQRSGFDDGEPFAVVQGYGKLFRHPTAVRRGIGGFRVAQHLHLPVTHDKQAEIAGLKRDDALIGERTKRFGDGLNRHRVVLHSTAGELDVAVDCDDASDAT